ncbi:replicative DNA helicase [Geomonas silvestris]|uniref:Replicative DNA helicase n=1 Tax=Geomonas silvestris TaxID=2740184 RepID=A0A6V8MH41_9BACT|nr:replicative DNA helicase [Geomonas silvestris]GFO59300.1 replicative DNA helicase [Geomonas silvestris]
MTTNQQLQPQAIDAEMSILGAIFLDGGAMDTVHRIMTAEDFYRESHRVIFKAMESLADRNEPIDLVTMVNAMKASANLESCGGAAYLYALAEYVPMAANVAYYCRIVQQKAVERRLIAAANNAIHIVYSGGDIEHAVAKIEAAVQPGTSSRNAEPVDMGRSVREAVERIECRYENKGDIQGLPYGIDGVDAATSGMHPGEFIVIAGRPSMGKTAFGLNVIFNACRSGKTAMLFALEMSRGDNVDRLTASHGVAYQRIRNGQLTENDWSKLAAAFAKMHGWNMMIDDTPAISLRELRAKTRRQKKTGLDLVVIDYLQLMSLNNSRDNRVQGLGEISRGLKQLARELEIPVIALSQLNRSVDGRPDKRPNMSDLRDSGEIEQDADVIIFPYRPAAYCQQCKDRVNDSSHNYREHQAKAEIIIEKQRAGERNISIPVCWLGEYQRFVGL